MQYNRTASAPHAELMAIFQLTIAASEGEDYFSTPSPIAPADNSSTTQNEFSTSNGLVGLGIFIDACIASNTNSSASPRDIPLQLDHASFKENSTSHASSSQWLD